MTTVHSGASVWGSTGAAKNALFNHLYTIGIDGKLDYNPYDTLNVSYNDAVSHVRRFLVESGIIEIRRIH